jgi:N-acetylglucosaminyldiphosphoundecaprenol N-acetyl-beta-D-mannosaminyltransferase
MEQFSTIKLSEYFILRCDLEGVDFNSKHITNTVNQYSYVIAEKDSEFKNALKNADILLPDGIGIATYESKITIETLTT